MKYYAKKVEIINGMTEQNYEVGLKEIETIKVDSSEKLIILTYVNNTKKITLVPYEGTIEITLLKDMNKKASNITRNRNKFTH
jgi:hypothetical protein